MTDSTATPTMNIPRLQRLLEAARRQFKDESIEVCAVTSESVTYRVGGEYRTIRIEDE